jgi:hypothetical protein
MSQLKEHTKTTTVRGYVPLHRGPEPLDWTFELFRIKEQTIQDMTWKAFLKQVELYKILIAFARNRAPIIQPDPSTRVADIQECRDKWGVLKVKLTGIRNTSEKWSSEHGCKDIHYLDFVKMPSECHIFMCDEEQIEDWIAAEWDRDEEEKAVVKALVDTEAVKFFEGYWGKKHVKSGSTYFKAMQSPQYSDYWEVVPDVMYEDLIQRSVTRNCVWRGLRVTHE